MNKGAKIIVGTVAGVAVVIAASLLIAVIYVQLNDCTQRDGYNADGTTDATKYPEGTMAGNCHDLNRPFQSIYDTFISR